MYLTLIIIHVIACIVLVSVVLLQVGRGRGMLGFLGSGGGDSFFGSRTGDVLTKSTTAVAIMFMLTSLSLAYLSLHRSGSVAKRIKTSSSLLTGGGAGTQATTGGDKIVEKGADMVENTKNKLMNMIPDLGGGEGSAATGATGAALTPKETTKSKIKYDKDGNKVADELKYDKDGKLVSHKEVTYDKHDKIIKEKEIPLDKSKTTKTDAAEPSLPKN